MKTMKTCEVVTKWSFNGEYIHTLLGDLFGFNGLTKDDNKNEMKCTYHCSKSAAKKALVGFKHHDLISIN